MFETETGLPAEVVRRVTRAVELRYPHEERRYHLGLAVRIILGGGLGMTPGEQREAVGFLRAYGSGFSLRVLAEYHKILNGAATAIDREGRTR